MGFMDKAKKLADQAQTKLDEVQKQFNESQSSGSNPSSGPGVEYDQHGRPVAKPSDGAHTSATPQQGDPMSESGPPQPPAEKTPHVAEAPGDSHTQGDPLADSSPKPSQPPAPPSGGSGLSSGDPLAG
jgi:hypothetical protein